MFKFSWLLKIFAYDITLKFDNGAVKDGICKKQTNEA